MPETTKEGVRREVANAVEKQDITVARILAGEITDRLHGGSPFLSLPRGVGPIPHSIFAGFVRVGLSEVIPDTADGTRAAQVHPKVADTLMGGGVQLTPRGVRFK